MSERTVNTSNTYATQWTTNNIKCKALYSNDQVFTIGSKD